MPLTFLNPDCLVRPRGYSHGTLAATGGRLLFVAGQIGWDKEGRLVAEDFVEQFAQALDNALAVVREAGGKPEHVARMVIYVVDKREYLAGEKALGEAYRKRMGKHFPAMALLEVKGLLEPGAKVEIEATAVLP